MIYLTKDKRIFFDNLNDQLKHNSAVHPLFRIETNVIPSINDYLSVSKHFGAMQGFKNKWQKIGFEMAIRSAYRAGIAVQEWDEFEIGKNGQQIKKHYQRIKSPVFDRAKLILRIWRPTFGTYDVFNPYTKAIIDGFVDAGVMKDDSCFNVYSFEQMFMGVDDSLKPTDEMKLARKWKRVDKPNKRLPVTARYYFDFVAC